MGVIVYYIYREFYYGQGTQLNNWICKIVTYDKLGLGILCIYIYNVYTHVYNHIYILYISTINIH